MRMVFISVSPPPPELLSMRPGQSQGRRAPQTLRVAFWFKTMSVIWRQNHLLWQHHSCMSHSEAYPRAQVKPHCLLWNTKIQDVLEPVPGTLENGFASLLLLRSWCLFIQHTSTLVQLETKCHESFYVLPRTYSRGQKVIF